MKKLSIILAAMLVCSVMQAQLVEGWQEIPTGVTENLFGVACLDKNEVVACGENGKILKTVDGGETWTVKFEKEGYDMIHVAFADAQVGYACGDSCWWNSDNHKGVIVKTTDGGETWQELPNTEFVHLQWPDWIRPSDLCVVDEETYFLFTKDAVLWRTTDGGQSFTSTPFELEMVNHCELFFEDETGYLVAIDTYFAYQAGIHIYKTTDSGLTWNEVVTNGAYFDYSVVTHFFDKNHVEMYGYFSEGMYNLFVTDDGFETTSYLNVECPIIDYYGMGNVSHSKYTSDTYGCILTGMTLMKGSTATNPFIMKDGWEHCEWVKQGIPDCENNGIVQCRDLYAVDGVDTVFYIAAENGFVYKSAMIPVNGVDENALQVNVYPNPAKDRVAIEGIEVKEVFVYDALGQVVKTVQGTNEIDLSGLVEGVYLLRIMDAEGKVYTNKITIQ